MTELVVLSGKGGTGKTSIAACLAVLAPNSITADCDVDAANLHLLLKPSIKEKYDFVGGIKAEINQDKCIQCGVCMDNCRFKAIQDYCVDTISCEGCAVCHFTCPVQAIEIKDHISGEYYLSKCKYGIMVHGALGIAEGNSGKLVAEIKKIANNHSNENTEFIIIDGPPGIGCPVVSSLTGADIALVVTEPTLSGIHDLERILQLILQLQVKAMVCINKADLHIENTQAIKTICVKSQIPIVGEINYDKAFIEAVNNKMPLLEYSSESIVAAQVKQLWNNISANILK
jgi:MinD superfamily P-loop ATPase